MSTAPTPVPELPFPVPTKAQCYAFLACMIAGGVLSSRLSRELRLRLRQGEMSPFDFACYNILRIHIVLVFQLLLYRCLVGKPMTGPPGKTLPTDLIPFLFGIMIANT